jgi:DNA repair protein RecO (recombination protein O)
MKTDTDGFAAWLLHQRPAKNTTSQVFFLTEEQGMVRAFCQGGRTPKKRAILQPFTPLWLMLDERHYGTYVKQVEMVAPSYDFCGERVLAGMYLNELLYRVLKPNVAEPMLFDAYKKTLASLVDIKSKAGLEVLLRQFERTLIHLLGYEISYTEDARSGDALEPQAYYRLIPGEGFVYAGTSGLLGADILAIHANIWDDPAVLKTAKFIMRRVIDHLLDGVQIQTRALYQA